MSFLLLPHLHTRTVVSDSVSPFGSMTTNAPRNRCPKWITIIGVVSLSVSFFSIFLTIASVKPFWYDELFTVALIELDSDGLAHALSNNWDLHPPGYFWITRISESLFWSKEAGTRMPSIFGLWLGCISLTFVLGRHVRSPLILLGALLPLLTSLVVYGTEARPYGVVFGAAMCAIACYELAITATKPTVRKISCLTLAFSLILGFISHYYFFLCICPFLAGEVIRFLIRRVVNIPIVISLILPCFIPLFHLRAIVSAVATYRPIAWNPPSLETFLNLYTNGSTPLFIFFLIMLLLIPLGLIDATHKPIFKQLINLETLIIYSGYLSIPILGVSSAFLYSGMISPRYTLPWIGGAILLIIIAFSRIIEGSKLATVASLTIALGLVSVSLIAVYQNAITSRNTLTHVLSILSKLSESSSYSNFKMVVANPFDALVYQHYAPDSLRKRLYCVVDPELAPSTWKYKTIDSGLITLRSTGFPFNIAHSLELIYSDTPFLLLFDPSIELPFDARLRTSRISGKTFRIDDSLSFMIIYPKDTTTVSQ